MQPTPAVATTCRFEGSYSSPYPWENAVCGAEYEVPAGCPFHFAGAADLTTENPVFWIQHPGDLDPTQVTGSLALVGTAPVTVNAVDVYTCTCERYSFTLDTHRYAVSIPGAQAGDTVSVGFLSTEGTAVVVGPPGPCPDPVWPENYDATIACDPCTNPDPFDDEGGGMSTSALSGCSIGHAGATNVVMIVAALVWLWRRSR